MRGRIAHLIITIFAGILLLLIVKGLLTIHNAPFSSTEVLASTNPNITTIPNEPLRMGQVYTKTELCGAEASSEEKEEYSVGKAIDGNMGTRWSSKFINPQWISITLCEEKTINRVVLYWETAYGKNYRIHVSDGEDWYKVFSPDNGIGSRDVITGTDVITHVIMFDNPVSVLYVRMYGILRGTEWGYSLWEFETFETDEPPVPISNFPEFDIGEVLDVLKREDPLGFYNLKSQLSPKGYYPRWFYDELNYWTVVGSTHSEAESLFSDDGMLGNPKRDFCSEPPLTIGFSLMPCLSTTLTTTLITAFDTDTVTHSLEDGYLPFPEVKWYYKDIELSQKVFPYQPSEGDSRNYIWYSLENKGTSTASGKLYFTIRPFQVTPCWMFGGLEKIWSIGMEGSNRFKINGNNGFSAITAPDDFGAIAYEDGDIIDFVGKGVLPPTTTVTSTEGYASAALAYTYSLAPGGKQDFMFAIPMDKGIDDSDLPSTPTEVISAFDESKAMWKGILDNIESDLPNQDIVNTFKSNVAYILVQKDSQALQPGSGNYDRSWMRDGADMGAALLRTGHFTEVKDYLGWVAGFQREDGLIPPVIYSEGCTATVPNEWDSQGEFIFLVSEYYKFAQDRPFLEQTFPNVVKALEFLEDLREQRLTPKYEDTRFYGILPESICHEGYRAPGVHCYWDDFWALKGWQEAREMAEILGRDDLIPWIDNEEQDFRKCFVDSIKRTMCEQCIEYIPGSTGGDFDATSTAVSVWPTEQTDLLKEGGLLPALKYTLDKYYQETFLPRLEHGVQFGYTPYEMRTAIAYLMLGQKEKTLKMLDYFLKDRRPLEWNHWAEVVHPGYRNPEYIGDMPHSWIGAIYVNLIRSLSVYEKDRRIYLPLVLKNSKNYHPTVALLTYHDRYVTAIADDCPLKQVPKQVSSPSECGRFTLRHLDDGKVALVTCHNRYVTAPMTGTTDLDWALRQEPELSECGRFTLHDLGSGKFAFETCADRYFTALDGNRPLETQWLVIAVAPQVWDWERFTLQYQ